MLDSLEQSNSTKVRLRDVPLLDIILSGFSWSPVLEQLLTASFPCESWHNDDFVNLWHSSRTVTKIKPIVHAIKRSSTD